MLKTYEEIYNTILPVMQRIEENERKTKAGRKPKVSDAQIVTLFIISFITNTPVLKLSQMLFGQSVKPYYIFRKTRIKRV
ncbi:MAG: hypothetical protein ACP5P0_00025 [Hydrogenobacter sp.]|jgi:hypothetical protein